MRVKVGACHVEASAVSAAMLYAKQHSRDLCAHREPELDPPLLLENVAVVLVGPKKPVSCGTIARSCSCFEVNDLRVVQPRCPPNTR
jgi:tRNA G18 (ribose-2'-O)-methylase SpoU